MSQTWVSIIYSSLVIICGASIKWSKLLKFKSNKKSENFWNIIKFLFCVPGIYLAYTSIIKEKRQEEINSINIAIPLIINPIVLIGFQQFPGDPQHGYIEIGDRRQISLKIFKENDSLKVIGDLYDGKGNVIADMTGNSVIVYNKNFDYNNEDKGIEIVSFDKRVWFQADANGNYVTVSGLFFTIDTAKPGQYLVRNLINKSVNAFVLEKTHDFIPEKEQITPIFAYPRVDSLGIRSSYGNDPARFTREYYYEKIS